MLATGQLQVSVLQETQIGDELSEKGLNSGHP
jgi:hypothetical protein